MFLLQRAVLTSHTSAQSLTLILLEILTRIRTALGEPVAQVGSFNLICVESCLYVFKFVEFLGTKGTAYTLLTPRDKEFAPLLVRNLEGANQMVSDDLMKLAMQVYFSTLDEKCVQFIRC